jgi:hypothetical protein
MLKIKGKTCMVEEPLHVKQLSLIQAYKIGLKTFLGIFRYGSFAHVPYVRNVPGYIVKVGIKGLGLP